MSDTRLLYVLVDAVRHDYVTPQRTPYLDGLADELGFARMKPLLGYSDAIRAAIFTGRSPDEHGYWMEYCYRPGRTPFGSLEHLRLLDAFPSDFVKRGTKVVLSHTVVPRLRRRAGYEHLSLRHLPFRALGVFDWTLRRDMTQPGALGVPSIFDRLDDHQVPWRYLDASKLGRKGLLDALAALPAETRFVFVYLHHVDMASHLFGIQSPLFERTLSRTDALTREVVERTRARLGDVETVVFSDHGMSAVTKVVSFPALWRDPDFPHRFCFALDATMVRLWWEGASSELQQRVRGYVTERAAGRFLEREELRELHLDFDGRLYGDEIYLLEPGTAIFPNFHSMLKPKAMHAYHPDDPDQQGIALGLASGNSTVDLLQLAPFALRSLGVETATPLAAAS
jgi:Type I phosphodiesterase / nucleotide pyrophosphatase